MNANKRESEIPQESAEEAEGKGMSEFRQDLQDEQDFWPLKENHGHVRRERRA